MLIPLSHTYEIGDLFVAQQPAGGQPMSSGGGGMAAKSGGGMATMATGMKEGQKKKKGQAGCLGGGMSLFVPLILMFVVFYFFLIRPQQKKQKEHQSMLGALRKGDQVITQGGILGKVTGLTDQYVVVEVQEKVRFRVLRSAIASKNPGASGGDSK